MFTVRVLVLNIRCKGNNNFFTNVFILFFFNIFYKYGEYRKHYRYLWEKRYC